MAYPVDIRKAYYYPEIWGEAGSITTTTSGAEIAYYSNFNDYIAQMVTLGTHPEAVGNGKIRVNTESGDDLIDSPTESRFYMNNLEAVNVVGKTSLGVYAYYPTGGSAETLYYRYGLRITKPTVYEKVLNGIPLSDAEIALDTKYEISAKIKAGLLSNETTPKFERIYEVARDITAAAAANPVIGSEVHPVSGKKAVLLSVAAEQHGTADQVYIMVRRDRNDIIKLDTNAFVNATDATSNEQLNYEQPLYVPATDTLEVRLENSVAIATFKVRFTYGIAPLTVIEKIKWGLALTDEDSEIASAMDLWDAAVAGVI